MQIPTASKALDRQIISAFRVACTFSFVLLFLVPLASGQASITYQEASVKDVMEDIQRVSSYRFLYRDALVTGKRVSFQASDETLVESFGRALGPVGLSLLIDPLRAQILVTATAPPTQTQAVFSGQVIDDLSGARLPFATLTWMHDGRLRGTTTNEAGAFLFTPSPSLAALGPLEIKASYVGYEPRQVVVDPSTSQEIPIRLIPQPTVGPEVVISGTLLEADLDTTWFDFLTPSLASSIGESSVLGSLQPLPSVSLTPGSAAGLNVRGSRDDGFQVLLDGVPIYNQQHFFGLFDAFNDKALQTVGFYYGITPASYPAPPGGTLAFMTRTGSQTAFKKSVGLSNTTLQSTLEGPLWGGRGSWLISGRHSYFDAVSWFNNEALIAQGLDLNRETSTPGSLGQAGNRQALFQGDFDARFYDLHGKLLRETAGGARFMFNLYLGGDDASSRAERLTTITTGTNAAPRLQRVPVETENAWGNVAVSVQAQGRVGKKAYGQTLLALSRYTGRFEKDDFLYFNTMRQNGGGLPSNGNRVEPSVDTFNLDNALTEARLSQQIDLPARGDALVSAGYALAYYRIHYAEQSVLQTFYDETRVSTLGEFFGQYERNTERLSLQGGLRVHYFSEGAFLRLSPRFRTRLFPQRAVSFGLGYSRNYQFLHRLTMEPVSSANIWVMSTETERPGSVDHINAGLYLRGQGGLRFQVEGYWKSYRNLREHGTTAQRRRLDLDDPLLEPWLHDSKGKAVGLEMMFRHTVGRIRWTHSYTLSRMDIQNDQLNEGSAFPAEWDRLHQYTSHVELSLGRGFTGQGTWFFGSGAPNVLADVEPGEPERLPAYHRLDVGVSYRRALKNAVLQASLSFFNVYDRANPWYRTPLPVVGMGQQSERIVFDVVDVYDLGFQPSFSLSFSF